MDTTCAACKRLFSVSFNGVEQNQKGKYFNCPCCKRFLWVSTEGETTSVAPPLFFSSNERMRFLLLFDE